MKSRSVALACAAPAVALFCLAGPAAADTLRSTLGQPLVEVSHSVDVRIADGVATYVVRRTYANAGTIADEVFLEIDLPDGAAATGLRIRARDRWYDGELLERERAALLYEQLTGLGPHAPRDPALLEWDWAGALDLYLFPVMPGAVSTVEYTLTVPTRYRDGVHVLSYPRPSGGEALAPTVIRVLDDAGDATRVVRIERTRVAPGAPVVLGAGATAPPRWPGEGSPEPGAGWATSAVVVEGAGTAATAKVDLEIAHTYRGDLGVTLVTPAGKHLAVRGREGGSEADVRGVFDVALPAGMPVAGTWTLLVCDHAGRDVGTIDRFALTLASPVAGKAALKPILATATDVPVFVPDAFGDGGEEGMVTIEIAPEKIDTVAARLARLEIAPGRDLFRLEVDAAPELRPLPKAPSVVFVVDASHSIDEEGIAAQLDVARAWLSHVPDASFEVVLYRRRAERLAGRFVPAKDFDKTIGAARAGGRLAPGNGSALDDGLRAAAAALAGRKGALRIVAATDTLLRPSLGAAAAAKALAGAPKGTIVHVVVPSVGGGDAPALVRDDDHELAPIAAAREGILVTIDGLPAAKPAALAAPVLELVRPMRIDHFRIEGITEDDARDVPEVLDEGAGVRIARTAGRAPAKIVLRGKIWGAELRREVLPTASFAAPAAAFVFGEDRFGGLEAAEMMKLARLGRAVSPVTSYLAIEPGVRPSKIGIDRIDAFGGLSGLGLRGTGFGGGGAALLERARPDLGALARPGVEACRARHAPPASWGIELFVETTLDEIVDVAVVRGGAPAMDACVVEAAWAVRLGAAFDLTRDSYSVTF